MLQSQAPARWSLTISDFRPAGFLPTPPVASFKVTSHRRDNHLCSSVAPARRRRCRLQVYAPDKEAGVVDADSRGTSVNSDDRGHLLSTHEPTSHSASNGKPSQPASTSVQLPSRTGSPSSSSSLITGEPTIPAVSSDTIPNTWARNAQRFPALVAVEEPHRKPQVKLTFKELYTQMQRFASGLQALGLQKGDKVCLFAENSRRWLVADQGIMMNGAADAVRGSTAPPGELAYILTQSGAAGLVVQDKETLDKLVAHLDAATARALQFVVVLWGASGTQDSSSSNGSSSSHSSAPPYAPFNCPLHSFESVVEQGRQQEVQQGSAFAAVPVSHSDLATLVYTSGTTGFPKAVMLSHGNLMSQMESLPFFLPGIQPGEAVLSLLPPWHIYERTVSYFVLRQGCKQVITNIRRFRDDLQLHPPDYFVCVPLVLDTLYSRVMAKLQEGSSLRKTFIATLLAASTAYIKAKRITDGVALEYAREPRPYSAYIQAALTAALLAPVHALASLLVYSKVRAAVGIRKVVVSGGGSLAAHLDLFYESIGLTVLNGWGLSETSPVLACRRNVPFQNVRGTVGLPTPGMQLRVVDPETLQDLPDGQQGLILARGPGVMQGYYGDEKSTSAAFKAGDGWYDTGDLGWRAPKVSGSRMAGFITLTGRSKDTLVLSNGKNVEPQPIEDAVVSSSLIKHAILVGQDKRELGILLFPDEESPEVATAASQAAAVAAAVAAGSAVPGGALGSVSVASMDGGVLAWAGTAALEQKQLEKIYLAEVVRLNTARLGYKSFEAVAQVKLVPKPLSVEDGTLTRTMKPRRAEVLKLYAAEVEALMARLR